MTLIRETGYDYIPEDGPDTPIFYGDSYWLCKIGADMHLMETFGQLLTGWYTQYVPVNGKVCWHNQPTWRASTSFLWWTGTEYVISTGVSCLIAESWDEPEEGDAGYIGDIWYSCATLEGSYVARGANRGHTQGAYEGTPITIVLTPLDAWKKFTKTALPGIVHNGTLSAEQAVTLEAVNGLVLGIQVTLAFEGGTVVDAVVTNITGLVVTLEGGTGTYPTTIGLVITLTVGLFPQDDLLGYYAAIGSKTGTKVLKTATLLSIYSAETSVVRGSA